MFVWIQKTFSNLNLYTILLIIDLSNGDELILFCLKNKIMHDFRSRYQLTCDSINVHTKIWVCFEHNIRVPFFLIQSVWSFSFCSSDYTNEFCYIWSCFKTVATKTDFLKGQSEINEDSVTVKISRVSLMK